MSLRHLMPWKSERDIEARREDPFTSLQREINSIFDEHLRGFFPSTESRNGFFPRLDISENDREILVNVELPGMDEKNVDVTIAKGELTISGEKKLENEEKNENYHRIERSRGSFRRTVGLPSNVEENRAEAVFKNGVLRISLPKTASSAEAAKKVSIKAG